MQKHLLDTTLPLSRDQYADRIDRMSTDSTTPYFHTKRGGIENNQNQKFRRWRASSEQDERNWIRINLDRRCFFAYLQVYQRGGGPRGNLELEKTRAREKLAFLQGVRKMLRDDEGGERCDLATCKQRTLDKPQMRRWRTKAKDQHSIWQKSSKVENENVSYYYFIIKNKKSLHRAQFQMAKNCSLL